MNNMHTENPCVQSLDKHVQMTEPFLNLWQMWWFTTTHYRKKHKIVWVGREL